MKQRFRIGHKPVSPTGCIYINWEALNESAKHEMWRYHPDLKNYSGSNISDRSVYIHPSYTRRYLPPLMRL